MRLLLLKKIYSSLFFFNTIAAMIGAIRHDFQPTKVYPRDSHAKNSL